MANILGVGKGGQDLDLDNLGSGIRSPMWDVNKDPLNA